MPHVQVIVRCRPPLPSEQQMKCTRVEANEVSNCVAVNSSKSETAKSFAFDRVLPESCSQEDVFASLSPMVDHALDGLHSTVFAYGQTGSGKTHTIEGIEYATDSNGKLRPRLDTPPSRHGVLPRVIQAVFDRTRDRMGSKNDVQYRLKCSFMQLYNEKVSDLLNPATRTLKEGLKIRWTRNDHFEVENLFVFECDSADQMREMLMMGVKEKVMSSHQMNHQSSRSHCIFTIHVHSWDPHNPECVIKSELSVVDLAGSEKLALMSSDPSPQLLKESIEINTSLLSLGKVITALAAPSKNTHVPYRDSKLTKLLKHALGGNSMTSMIACISPLDSYVEETLSTLMYAGRARNITTVPKVNEDPRSALIRQLREEIASLKAELEYYKQLSSGGAGLESKIHAAFIGGGAPTGGGPTLKTGGDARPHSSDDAIAALSPKGSSSLGGGDELGQADLAEKLLASCKMLKNVVGVNNQLRAAFDKLKASKEDASQREMELNAENIALRERIEMLESIALADEMGGTVGGASSAAASSLAGISASAASSSGRTAQLPRSGNSDAELLAAYGQRNAAAAAAREHLLESQLANGGGAHASSASYHAPQRQEATHTNPINDRLRDYTAKYRNPQRPTRYEDYYGAAKKAVSSSSNTKVAQELDRLMKHIPKATQQMVPASLANPHAYGSLAFGGTDNDTRDLDEKRRQRQRKLQMLQEQHDHMQRGFSGGTVPLPSVGQSVPTSSAGHPDAAPRVGGRGAGVGSSGYQQQQSNASFASTAPPLDFSSGASPGGGANKLFQYLSQDEATKMFTPEQQERLRMRGGPSTVTSASTSLAPSSNGLPLGGSRFSQTTTPRGGAPSESSTSALQRQLDQLAQLRRQ